MEKEMIKNSRHLAESIGDSIDMRPDTLCEQGLHDYSYDPYEGIKTCQQCGKIIKV